MANSETEGTRVVGATVRDHRGLERIDGRMYYGGTELPHGEWHSEPDHVDFEAHGFACLLHRGPLGAWCGYVAVPPGHPWHGVSDGSVVGPDEDGKYGPRVHGGLTYSNNCQGAICHVPKPGESDDVWWLGFDCAHLGDIVPGMLAIDLRRGQPESLLTALRAGETYKTVDFVRRETEQLAEQAARAKAGA